MRKDVIYPEYLALDADSFNFGVLKSPSHMLVLSNRQLREEKRAEFGVNIRRKQVYIRFRALQSGQQAEFRLCIPFEQLKKICQTQDASGDMSFVITLDTPPHFFRSYNNVVETHKLEANTWKDEDRWYRQTDIEATKPEQETRNILPIELRRTKGVINLGRWTTYRLTMKKDQVNLEKLEQIQSMLKDHNIPVSQVEHFEFSYEGQAVWDLIDPSSVIVKHHNDRSFTNELVAGETSLIYILPFAVRYALEVCISKSFLNEYSLDEECVTKLATLPEDQAVHLLEYIVYKNQQFLYNPHEIFNLWRPKLPIRTPKLPKNCCLMRAVTVTPTTIIVNSPTVEVTNRVIRQYEHVADRFLRVRFEDDLFRGWRKIFATDADTTNEIFSRVMRTLMSGIVIGGRKYEFLAYGNSQLREHGAYFFASTPTISAANIRAWMGRFDHEKVIAKHAARIGQCFSTTRAVRGSNVDPVRQSDLIPDIERNGFNFTDGVGKISRFLAEMVSMELGIQTHAGGAPSLFQFRLSGCKGVLALASPDDKSVKWNGVALRKSQFKFEADHHGLEVIRHSEFWSASLNRQLILVLSALGVDDDVFLAHQEEEITGLREAMEDDNIAMSKLNEFVDPNHAVMVISHLIADGFRRTNEPFATSLLRLWRAWRTKDLKERAKLKVNQGAFLLGCIDETATLRGHFNDGPPPEIATYEEKVDALPQIFLQVSRPDAPGTVDVIEGVCILARNPSLHPGDIRVVKAVDVSVLHHLKDVVVLPQTGDRDLSSMCSGGDLDGDDYIVIWDPGYIPKVWNHPPMDYTPLPPKKSATNVSPHDIMRFFVQYMKNDFLPRIAHAHLAWADFLDEGLTSDRCLKLAALHSKAVDYPKTGQPATMERSMNPRSWPHFMQKRKETSYKSEKILGKLFDRVESVAFEPNYEGQFDNRILFAFETDQKLFDDAQDLKESYDESLSRIMALHEIKTEFEVFATLCLGHSQATKDYKFHEQLGRLSTALKQQFKDECIKRAGGSDYNHLAPYAVAMYKVTQAHLDEALAECVKHGRKATRKNMPYISFPWVLQSTLSEIVSKQRRPGLDDAYEQPRLSKDTAAEPEAMPRRASGVDQEQMDVPQKPLSGNVEPPRTNFVEAKAMEASDANEKQGRQSPLTVATPSTILPKEDNEGAQTTATDLQEHDDNLFNGLDFLMNKESKPETHENTIKCNIDSSSLLTLGKDHGRVGSPHAPTTPLQQTTLSSSKYDLLSNWDQEEYQKVVDSPHSIEAGIKSADNRPITYTNIPDPVAPSNLRQSDPLRFEYINYQPTSPIPTPTPPADMVSGEQNEDHQQSTFATTTSRSSLSSSIEDFSPLTKVESQGGATTFRRRRIHGPGRTTSGSGRSGAEIEALLAQSDSLIEQRRRKREQGSSSSYSSALETLTPVSLAPEAETVPTVSGIASRGSATSRSGSLSHLYKPSVKHLECYYWKHRGRCRFSEEECLYAHHDTGMSTDEPFAIAFGEPTRAGKALEEALERQEGSQRSISTYSGSTDITRPAFYLSAESEKANHQIHGTQSRGLAPKIGMVGNENQPPSIMPTAPIKAHELSKLAPIPVQPRVPTQVDEAELEATEYVPKPRTGRTALERLERLVNRD